ncbi:MAG TPA: helix-turn-helix transcriptional regulator [Solirubrobacterales bacterium]|jgi:transcriptional regulator with XRE-family HTH domain|nr:helix-turn-helix transcriptional regulator [Solirubrobacterales bacterium]
MRCQDALDVGRLLREARELQGLSQRRLALRAGTSQDAISRIERGVEAPTLARFAQLMLALGRRPVLGSEPLDSPVPPSELAAAREMSASERLREAASWNRISSRLAAAGAQARRAGHPATRRSEG